jgi:hypothetical protein
MPTDSSLEVAEETLFLAADDPMPTPKSVLPGQKIAYWVSTIHRVKQVTHLGVFPDKLTLDLREPNLPHTHLEHQHIQRVLYLREWRFEPVTSYNTILLGDLSTWLHSLNR